MMVGNLLKGWRKGSPVAVILAVGVLAGCQGAPTYGTGTRSDKQLLEDLTGMISLAPKNGPEIAYEPRPELIKTAPSDQLPVPQEGIVTASTSTDQWPESPEERRARIREDATLNRDNVDFRPAIRSNGTDTRAVTSPAAADRGVNPQAAPPSTISGNAREEYRRRKQENEQGSPTERKFLSEPPLEYRVPVATAAADDLGEDEDKKERRLKSESRKAAGKTSWRDYVPWL